MASFEFDDSGTVNELGATACGAADGVRDKTRKITQTSAPKTSPAINRFKPNPEDMKTLASIRQQKWQRYPVAVLQPQVQ